ncbi:g2302 [Coccomyxa elongata]
MRRFGSEAVTDMDAVKQDLPGLETVYTCRICFEETRDASQLISPCLCKGTQKYVHSKCLRRWQDSVQRLVQWRDKIDDRAYRCSVCRELYSMAPRPVGGQWRLWGAARTVAATCLIALLALGLTGGPPWPHVAIVLLLVLGTRSHSVLCIIALVLACILATLHARGLRVVMRVDATGRLGLAVIRHGAPVEGVRPGILLAASDELERSIFWRSVVLIYEHSRRGGARGVILSQPLGPSDPRVVPSRGPAALPPGSPQLSHFLGGPVGMPGDGPIQELAVIHTLAEVPGARPLLAPNASREEGTLELFEGGSLTDVVAAASAAGPPPVTRWGARGGGRSNTQHRQPRVHVYHGICAWSEGQLEGELRSGSWGFTKANTEDVLGVPPEQLWARLVAQPSRLQWLNR